MPDDPFGANGVAVGDGNIYAANTGKGILVSVPILADGSAGEPELVAGAADCDAEVKELYGMDGIALDAEGNVFALLVLQNQLVKIPTDGTFSTLLACSNADLIHGSWLVLESSMLLLDRRNGFGGNARQQVVVGDHLLLKRVDSR